MAASRSIARVLPSSHSCCARPASLLLSARVAQPESIEPRRHSHTPHIHWSRYQPQRRNLTIARPTSSPSTTNPRSPSPSSSAPSPSYRRLPLRQSPQTDPLTTNAPPPTTSKLRTHDRGPASEETTQTDFATLNVLGNTTTPSTSVDICAWDGFVLDSGLQVGDGDGVVLVGGEAFVWRPWMGGVRGSVVEGEEVEKGMEEGARGRDLVHGSALKSGGNSDTLRSGGIVNKKGQFEVPEEAWGLFKLLWPKPDLIIVGTGPTIRPLAPSTREHLQSIGLRIEVLDTRNAAAQFNLLATERGVQEIAAALVPIGFGAKDT